MSSQGQPSSSLPSSRATTTERSDSEIPKDWRCSCGTGDGSGSYIQCDNEDCRVGWYHWECVRVTEEPAGTWLCPSCSPNAAFYIKQLVKGRAASPLLPTSGKAVTPTSSKAKEPVPEVKEKGTVKKGIAVKDPVAEEAKGQEAETTNGKISKKGIATKKAASERAKPRWIGWVEMSSDGEEDYKKKVNAKFLMEDGVKGKRTRGSKASPEEDETGPRRFRTRSRPGRKAKNVVETDSDEEEGSERMDSVYQKHEEEEEEEEEEDQEETSGSEDGSMHEEAPVNKDAPVKNDASVFQEDDEEDTMEIDQESEKEDQGSADEPSDTDGEDSDVSPPARRERESGAPGPVRKGGGNGADGPSQRTATCAPAARSDTPSRFPTSDRTGGMVAASPTGDDAMDLDEGGEGHGSHGGRMAVTVSPAVESNDYAARYQRQGNCWGEFPESAIRSTLPRLA
ncbi:hypothetical protein HO133_001976 [Letharia lupina]|uniref:PHD-type domain-containing protein n=1 Tax=Letharia lupina TaxID=560253 RepID=A0A8H6CEN6_9LECA|nr:uncharacterized protein HO133_001976 [Letharia lupina]KAF6222008.1 hypothetical protein HO133_001976 [Letharia lupina]